jgi:hypothetical protein
MMLLPLRLLVGLHDIEVLEGSDDCALNPSLSQSLTPEVIEGSRRPVL